MNIVLLHGLTGSKRYFNGLEQRLQSIPNIHVSSFDLLGFGTDYKNTTSDFSLAEHLAHISGKINGAFGDKRVILIGHSLGGVLSLAWAKQNPNQIEKIILINTPLADTSEEAYQSIIQTSNKLTSWPYLIEKARPFAFVSCKILCGFNTMKYFERFKPHHISQAVFEDYRRHSWNSLTQTLEKVFLWIPAGAILDTIHNIPILIISGSTDSPIMRKHPNHPLIQHIELDGGHQILLEKPEAVYNQITEFLTKATP